MNLDDELQSVESLLRGALPRCEPPDSESFYYLAGQQSALKRNGTVRQWRRCAVLSGVIAMFMFAFAVQQNVRLKNEILTLQNRVPVESESQNDEPVSAPSFASIAAEVGDLDGTQLMNRPHAYPIENQPTSNSIGEITPVTAKRSSVLELRRELELF